VSSVSASPFCASLPARNSQLSQALSKKLCLISPLTNPSPWFAPAKPASPPLTIPPNSPRISKTAPSAQLLRSSHARFHKNKMGTTPAHRAHQVQHLNPFSFTSLASSTSSPSFLRPRLRRHHAIRPVVHH